MIALFWTIAIAYTGFLIFAVVAEGMPAWGLAIFGWIPILLVWAAHDERRWRRP